MKTETTYSARHQALFQRYRNFQDNFNKPGAEVIKVFEPLPHKYVDDIMLIRSVSKDLQAKKEEDMRKAAAAALEMKEAKKAESQENTEEKSTETVKEN